MMCAEPIFTACHECDRGGNGNAKGLCSCGWKVRKPGPLGCFLGTPIVGEPRKHKVLTRSQRRYQDYLDVSDCFGSFHEYLLHGKYEKESRRDR